MVKMNTPTFSNITTSYFANATSSFNITMNSSLYLNGTDVITSKKDSKATIDSSVYILLILCFLAVLENAFTCYIIHANKILRTATNVFVFSLCVTDILCAGVLIPIALFYRNSHVYGYFAVIIVFTYAANLTAVTYERLVSITKPLRYQSIITKRVAFKITMAAWIIPITYCLLPLIWKSNVHEKAHKVYMVISLLLFLVSPLFFIFFVYLRILIEVHRLLKGSRHLYVYTRPSCTKSNTSISERLRKASSCCLNSISGKNISNTDNAQAKRYSGGSCDELDHTLRSDLYTDSPREVIRDHRLSVTSSMQSCDSVSSNNAPNSVDKNFLTVKGNFKKGQPIGRRHINRPVSPLTVDSSPGESGDASRSAGTTPQSDAVEMESQRLVNDEESSEYSCKDKNSEKVNHSLIVSREQEQILQNGKIGESDFCSDANQAPRGSHINDFGQCYGEDENRHDDSTHVANENDSGIEEERFKDAECNISNCPSNKGNKKKRSNIIKKLIEIRKGNSTDQWNGKGRRRQRKSIRRRRVFEEIRASTAFAAVAFTYMFTWIPVIYMTFMEVIGKPEMVPLETITDVNTWTIALNAAIDPLFYALILRNFRKTIRRQFRRMKNRRA